MYEPQRYWNDRARKYQKEPLDATCFIGASEYNRYLDFLHKKALNKVLPSVIQLRVGFAINGEIIKGLDFIVKFSEYHKSTDQSWWTRYWRHSSRGKRNRWRRIEN